MTRIREEEEVTNIGLSKLTAAVFCVTFSLFCSSEGLNNI